MAEARGQTDATGTLDICCVYDRRGHFRRAAVTLMWIWVAALTVTFSGAAIFVIGIVMIVELVNG